ncbi:MAG: DUF1800 domain-containing protein, partial [Planctomycetaceae bacterium]|nr:DUF1800 domain-containing protein [Planctomycetaceae bacterium]
MTMTFDDISADWAWAAYEPTPEHPWDRQQAAHLFRRAGFAVPIRELDEAVRQSPQVLVRNLCQQRSETPAQQREYAALAASTLATGQPRQLAAWWLHRLINTPDVTRERTTLFWHGHFATSAEKVTTAQLMFEQNELLRSHALGNFHQLAQAISRDPAMLIYLDSASNRKAHPNENFARELMELFCLGEGNYTEQDIRELARCFTGWEVRRDEFRFNPYQHDSGLKSFLGTGDVEGGEQGVDVVVSQAACPEFLCRKLVTFFLFDEPVPSPELLAPLAEELRANDLEIGPTVQRILGSNLCFSRLSRGRKVRSPVDLAVGLLRGLDGSTNVFDLSNGLRGLGQELFYPPNVKGWDGGRTWINSATLLGRANFVRQVVNHKATRFDRQPLEEYCAQQGWTNGSQFVEGIVDTL